MSNRCRAARHTSEAGFALLVLLGLIGMGSVGILLAVQRFVPPLSDVVMRTDDNLAFAQTAVRAAFRNSGAFPASLNALAVASGLDTNGRWRRDPYNATLDLDYRVLATGVRLRSRGPDRRLGTADDVQWNVAAETQLRIRQRERLRLIRAVLLRSPYRYVGSMSASDLTSMRTSMGNFGIARRQWFSATVAERTILTTQMATATATIAALVATHARPPLPAALTGAGGLMEQLAMPDTRATDGRGSPLARNTSVGLIARGYDAVGGTDDDM